MRINRYINAPKVRLIGADGQQIGIVSSSEALVKALEEELDLVEISPDSNPPVCRIMDYGKYLFEQRKRKKNKSKQIQVKEIKMRPVTEVGDYKIKLRKAIDFLQQGNKVKITVRFRGREMSHQEFGADILKRMERDLQEYGSVEQAPKLEGRQLVMLVGPTKK